MTAPWLCTPTAAAPANRRRAMRAAIPRIVTDRLILRAIGAVETGDHPLDPDRVAVYRLPPDMGATT